MTLPFRHPARLLLSPLLFLAAGIRPATARRICVPLPAKSAADHLLEADTAALAREDPDKPFSLEAPTGLFSQKRV